MEELAGYIAQQCELTFATDVDDPLPRLEQMQGALAQFLSGDSRCLVAYLRADPWPAGPTDEEKYHKASDGFVWVGPLPVPTAGLACPKVLYFQRSEASQGPLASLTDVTVCELLTPGAEESTLCPSLAPLMHHLLLPALVQDAAHSDEDAGLLAQATRVHALLRIMQAGKGGPTVSPPPLGKDRPDDWIPWFQSMDNLLAENDEERVNDPSCGPHTELPYWTQRAIRLQAALSALQARGGLFSGMTTPVASASDSLCIYTQRLTDALAEAQDCARYLVAMEPWLDPLYSGTSSASMSALADAMDGLLGAIASALTSSRVFSQPHRPAVLIQAVCARLATLCIEHVHAVARGDGTSIWDAPPAELLARVSACTRVHARFQSAFFGWRDKLAADPTGPQLEFSTSRVFRRFNLVVARITAVGTMISSSEAVRGLSRVPIHGTGALAQHLSALFQLLRSRRYDPLEVGADEAPIGRSGSFAAESQAPSAAPAGVGPPNTPERSSTKTSLLFPRLTPTPWSVAAGVSDVHIDMPASSRRSPSPSAFRTPAGPQVFATAPMSHQVSRQPSLRATRHLRTAATSRRSLSPTVDRDQHSPSFVRGNSRSQLDALLPLDFLSPVGMNTSTVVEVDAVIAAETRFRHHHSKASVATSQRTRPQQRSTHTMNKRLVNSLALRREQEGDNLLSAFEGKTAAAPELPTFNADYLAFQDVIEKLTSLAGQLVSRSVNSQPSALHAAIIAGTVLLQPLFKEPSLQSTLLDMLNVTSAKLSAEVERSRKLTARTEFDVTDLSALVTFARRFSKLGPLLVSISSRLPEMFANSRLPSQIHLMKEMLTVIDKVVRGVEASWIESFKADEALLRLPLVADSGAVLDGSGGLVVNWPHQFDRMWSRAKHLCLAGRRLPMFVQAFVTRRPALNELHHQLKHLVACVSELEHTLRVNPTIRPLFMPALRDCRARVVSLCVDSLQWSSPDAISRVAALDASVVKVLQSVTSVKGIMSTQTRAHLRRVRSTDLASFVDSVPSAHGYTVGEFASKAAACIFQAQSLIVAAVGKAEASVKDAVAEALKCYAPNSVAWEVASSAANIILKDVESQVVSVLRIAVVSALLKFASSLLPSKENGTNPVKPLLVVGIRLQIPNAVLEPPIATIQDTINSVARAIAAVPLSVRPWTSDSAEDEPVVLFSPSVLEITRDTSIAKRVTSSRDVLLSLLRLTGVTATLSGSLDGVVAQFQRYDHLWQENREASLNEFLASTPSVEEYSERLESYSGVVTDLSAHTPPARLGWLSVDTAPMRRALAKEASKWQQCFGEAFVEWIGHQVDLMKDFFENTHEELSRPVVSLHHVPECLANVVAIDAVDAEVAHRVHPIKQANAVFQKYGLGTGIDVLETVRHMWDAWITIRSLASQTREDMLARQAEFLAILAKEQNLISAAVNSVASNWAIKNPGEPNLATPVAKQRLQRFQADLNSLRQRIDIAAQVSKILGRKFPTFPALKPIEEELALLSIVLNLLSDVQTSIDRYKQRTWKELRFEAVSQDMLAYASACKAVPESAYSLPCFKTLSKLIDQFSAIMPLLTALSHPTVKVRHWRALESGMNSGLPTSANRLAGGTFALSAVLATPILRHRTLVESITHAARKEAEVEVKLAAVVKQWESASLSVLPAISAANHGRRLLCIHQQSASELLATLEESQVTLSMLNSSRYHHPYAAELTDWITRLSLIREHLEPTLTIQSSLLYLENVFSSVNGSAAASATDAEDSMTVQLQAESAVFASLCKLWGRLMSRVEAHPNVIHTFVVDSTLAHSLPYLEAQLDSCKHALSGYLTGKRVQFPRFFFLSDSALLEVLALSAGIPSVRRHLASMFDSVLDLIIHPRVRSSVIGFVSTGRCKLEFDALHTVHTRGRVESWMQQLLTSSRSAVRSAVITAAQVSAGAATLGRSPLYLLTDTKAQVGEQSDVAGLSSALLSLPPQALVIAHRMLWTVMCETALKAVSDGERDALNQVCAHLLRGFQDLIVGMAKLRGEPTTQNQAFLALEALITLESHHINVVQAMLAAPVVMPVDGFEWRKNFRCYFVSRSDVVSPKALMEPDDTHRFPWPPGVDSRAADGHCRLEITDVALEYSYEYIGGPTPLVLTPLTSRCHVTLAHALRAGFGGSPVGPAGTGKTETVKDLGRSLGRFVVVAGCGEETGADTLSRLYKGTAQTGAWLDLDEFNRLAPNVMSVAAGQVSAMLAAIRTVAPFFTFPDGWKCALRFREAGLFITMNPDYAGRSQLPDNLQACFRSVAMVVPDSNAIVQVKLACQGFVSSARLASRLDQLFQSARNTIEDKHHYDFGLRALLAVLKCIGASSVPSNKMRPVPSGSEGAQEVIEARIAFNAVTMMVLPTLTGPDREIFVSLLNASFQGILGPAGVGKPAPGAPQVEAAVSAACAAASSRNIIPSEAWRMKLLELSSVLQSRTGVVILGPAFSGKTGLVRALVEGLSTSNQPSVCYREYRMYPKSLPLSSLYGHMNPLTSDWTDGVLSRVWRKALSESDRRASSGVLPSLRSVASAVWWGSIHMPVIPQSQRQPAGVDASASSPSSRSTSSSSSSEDSHGGEEEESAAPTSMPEATWFVLDGPVEPVWVESLNPVLDDTKALTLVNGDRLAVDSSMRFIMETSSLDNASPATVSRCGIVCVSPAVVGWRSILEAACIQLPLGLSRHLLVMLSAVFEPAVVFLSQHASPVNHQSFASGGVDHLFLPLPPAHVMKSVLDTALSLGKSLAPESVAETLLEAQLPTGFEGTALLPQQKPTVLASVGFDAHNPGGMLSPAVAALWTRILTYAIVNVVGGPLSQSGQQSFHQFLAAREFAAPRLSDSVSDMETAWFGKPDRRFLYAGEPGFNAAPPNGRDCVKLDLPILPGSPPPSDALTVYDYFVNEAGEWELWSERWSKVDSPMRIPKALASAIPALRGPHNLWSIAFEAILDPTPLLQTSPHASRLFFMLSLGVSAGLPVLVTGPPVCGKSSLIQRFGRRLSKATLAGPDPAYTPRIGDVCKEEDVLAVVTQDPLHVSQPASQSGERASGTKRPSRARRGSIVHQRPLESAPGRRRHSEARRGSVDGGGGGSPKSRARANSAFANRRGSRPSSVDQANEPSPAGLTGGQDTDSSELKSDLRSVATRNSLTRSAMVGGSTSDSRKVIVFRSTQLAHSTTPLQFQRRVEKVLEKYVGGVLGVPTGVALPSHPRKAAHTADSVASPAGPRGPTRLSFSSSLPGAPDEGDEASIGSVDDETDGGPSFAMPRVEKLDKTLLLFIDDVSLPGSDKWGDWPTSEALRELLDTGKYHSSDRSSKCWEVRGLQLLAAAPHAGLRFGEGSWDSAPGAAGSEVDAMYHVPRIGPSAGACGLSQRVAAKFLLVHCPEPSQGSVMSWLFGPIVVPNVLLPSPVSTLLPGALLAAASNLVYTSLRTALIPALPSVPVPCFSLADLNRVKQGVFALASACTKVPLEDLMRIWLHEMERDLLDRIGSGAGFRVTLPGLATVLPGTLQLGSDNVMNAVFRSAVCDAMTTMSSPLYFKRSGQDVPSLESFSTAVSPASDRPTPDQLLVTHSGYVQAACSSLLSSLSSPLAELQREAALEAAAWSAIQPVAESSQPPPAVEVPLYVNFLDGPRSVEEMEASKVQPFGVVVKPRNVSVVNSDGIASVQSRIQTIVDWGSRPPEATTPSKGSEVEGVLTSGEASGDNLMKAVNSPSVVLFEQVVVLVCKLARLLSIPHRHGILLGQGGVGKRTVCKLAAQVLGCATGILEVGADVSRSPHVETGPVPMGARGEPICSAIDELKGFVKSAGVKGVHTVVIIPEDCLADPAALQCVAEYLSTGDAAGMFTREEISTFMQDVPSNELSLSGEDTQSPIQLSRNHQTSVGGAGTGKEGSGKSGKLSLSIPTHREKSPTNTTRPHSMAHAPSGGGGALIDDPYSQLMDAFNARVSSRLHLILCITPEFGRDVGGLRSWFNVWPSIPRSCSILWYQPWRMSSKLSVGTALLSSGPPGASSPAVLDADLAHAITLSLSSIHERARLLGPTLETRCSVTPQMFLTAIRLYSSLSRHVKSGFASRVAMLSLGLDKLSRARSDILALAAQAAEVEADLKGQSVALDALVSDIAARTEVAKLDAARIDGELAVVAEEAREVQITLTEVELELAAAQPAVAAALESLRKVNPSDVATLRALSQPPGLIKRIMDGVLLLLQKPVAKPKLGGGGGVGVGGAGAPASVLGQALDDMFLLPSWEVSTKLLSSMSAPGFLKMLADFDPNTVNDETVELLGPYIDMPDFEEKSARRVCGSMSGLCTWVRGMVTYQDLIKVVKPKDDAVRLQQQRMAAKKALLSRAQANLQESWDALSALTAKLEAAKQSKILLQSRLDDIRVKMSKAGDLLDSMASEQSLWAEQRDALEAQAKSVDPAIVFTVAAVVFAAPHTLSDREQMMTEWVAIAARCGLCSPAAATALLQDLSFMSTFVRFETSSLWQAEGLSMDPHSKLNALAVTVSIPQARSPTGGKSGDSQPLSGPFPHVENRAVLLIDPDGMGRDWVERRRRSGLVTVSSTQSRPRMPAIKQGAHSLGAGSVGVATNNSVSLEDSLRRCMSTGTALLVCDVGDSIPSVVRQAAVWLHRHASQPGTRADLSHLYGSSSVSLGSCPINGIEVEVCEGFELYIDCLVRAPTIDPEMSSCTSVVNFGASFPALRSALLDTIIDCEHPDVNARKQALLATSHALECEVTDLSMQLLQRLSQSRGSLLDDLGLITVLREMKRTHLDIADKQAETSVAVALADTTRSAYGSVATAGAVVYIGTLSMAAVSPNYQMAFTRFLNLFVTAVRSCSCEDNQPVPSRLSQLEAAVTGTIVASALRGLLPEHELSFLVGLSLQMDQRSNRISPDELGSLRSLLQMRSWLQSSVSGQPQLQIRVDALPEHPKVKEACAKAVRLLSVSEALASKAERSSAVYRAWREWLRCPEPENVPVPNSDDAAIGTLATPQQIMKSNHSAYTGALTPVQHLLFVLAIRPDRSMPALRQYVSASLSEVRRAPAASISAESSPTTPCLFLCRNGEDGESTVGSLAALAGVPLIIRSVGIGQLSLIDATFRKASTEGSWLCLSNCHLAALPNDDSDTSSLLQHIEAELRAGARSATAFHPSFRLWLVSDVGTPLPSSLLQLCTIAVVDSTPGSMVDSIRSSIRRLPVSVLETIEDTDNVQWRKLVFMLCVLHATMVGRGKYARVGWSRQYRFSASDFAASVAILSRAIRDKQQEATEVPVPWQQLQYVIAQCVYGGRATDPHDVRVARAYGDVWLHEVAVQAGYTFRYVEELEGESGPTLGWLGWRDREPPLPVRVPAGGVGGRPRDGGARRLSLLTQRRQSALRPAVGMEVSQLSSTYGSSGNGVKLAGPSDSDAKTLEDFMSFVERLDLMEGPELYGIHAKFSVEHRNRLMDVTSESLLKMSSPSRRVYVEGTTSQPLSLPMLQAILEGLPAVKVLQVPADVEDAQAMQDWLGSEVATLRAAVTSVQRDVFELLSMQRLGLPLLEHQVDMMLALSTSRVPESWAKRIVTPASVVSISDWLGHLNRCWTQYRNLCTTDMKAWSSKPITIWLGGSRHPVAFFEGIRRVCAASRPDCSLDGVRLLAEVMSESDIALLTNQSSREVARGVVLTGLTLVGGSWDIDSNTLIDLKDTDSVVTAAMLPLLVRPLAESDADFDADRVGSTVSSVAIAGGARLPSDALQGRVGPGCVLDTPSHDGRSPDCPPSYFNAGTRQHRVFTNSKYFACPVYSHARRGADDHVFDVWLPASRPAQHWTLRGVHLLL